MWKTTRCWKGGESCAASTEPPETNLYSRACLRRSLEDSHGIQILPHGPLLLPCPGLVSLLLFARGPTRWFDFLRSGRQVAQLPAL